MFSDMKYSNIKNFLLPVGVIVAILVLGVVVANFLLSKVSSTLAFTHEQETQNQVLKDRLSTLQELSEGIRTSVNIAALAIPDQNPSVLIVSQLKSIAGTYDIVLSNLTINALGLEGTDGQVVTYDVAFEAAAPDYESVSLFIDNLSKVTPLVNLSSLEITTATGAVSAEVKLIGFSSPFPSALPALDAPISGLTPEETDVLNTVGSFVHPNVIDQVAPQEFTPREDPFSLNL
jgi:hypothetical protein